MAINPNTKEGFNLQVMRMTYEEMLNNKLKEVLGSIIKETGASRLNHISSDMHEYSVDVKVGLPERYFVDFPGVELFQANLNIYIIVNYEGKDTKITVPFTCDMTIANTDASIIKYSDITSLARATRGMVDYNNNKQSIDLILARVVDVIAYRFISKRNIIRETISEQSDAAYYFTKSAMTF